MRVPVMLADDVGATADIPTSVFDFAEKTIEVEWDVGDRLRYDYWKL